MYRGRFHKLNQDVMARRIFDNLLVVLVIAAGFALNIKYVVSAPDTPRFIGTWDAWLLYGPNQFFLDYCVSQGEYPLWNPLILCGTPFAANPQVQACYPPNLIRSILTLDPTPLRTHVSVAIMIFVHVLVSGLGVYRLARFHGLGLPAAWTAVSVFLGNWLFIFSVNTFYVWITTITWFPWLFLCAYKAFDAKEPFTRARAAIGAGLFLGLTLLGGNPQLPIYTVFALFATFPLYAFRGMTLIRRLERPEVITRLWSMVIVAIVTCCVGFLAAAALIVPSSEVVGQSTRAKAAGLEQDESLKGEISLPRFVDIIVNQDVGIGVGATLLCAVALVSLPKRGAVLYAAVFLLMADFSLGPPFPISTLLENALPFELSQRWYAWALFGMPLAMLAAHGVDGLTRKNETPKRKFDLFVVLVFVVAVIIAVTISSQETAFTRSLANLFPAFGVLAAIACLHTWPHTRFAAAALPALVFLELTLCTWQRLPARFADEFKPYPGTLDDLRTHPIMTTSNTREVEPYLTMNQPMYRLQASITGYDPIVLRAMNSLLNATLYEQEYFRGVPGNVSSSIQRYNLFLKREAWLVSEYVRGGLPDRAALFPPTTTAYVNGDAPKHVPEAASNEIPKSSVSGRTTCFDVEVHDLNVNANALSSGVVRSAAYRVRAKNAPRRHSALRVTYRANCDSATSVYVENDVTGERYDLFFYPVSSTGSGTAQLEWPLPDWGSMSVYVSVPLTNQDGRFSIEEAYIALDDADEGGKVRIAERGANYIEFEVQSLKDYRLLLFAEARFPEWRASVDGQAVPILDANDAVMAIEVPPGDHRIWFEYTSARSYASMAVSSITWVTAILALGVLQIVSRRRGDRLA